MTIIMKYHIERVVLFPFLLLFASGVHGQTVPVVSMEDSPHFVADQSIHQFNIRIDDLTELFAFSIELSYDPTAIQVLGVFSFDFLSTSSTSGSRTVQYSDYSTPGKLIVDEAILGVTPETSTSGVLFTVFYRAVQFGVQKEVPIDFTVCLLRDEYNNPLTRTVHDGLIYLWYGRAKVKVLLQGPYNTGTGQMSTTLRDADDVVQRTSPFTQDPVSFPEQLPNGVVDWVLVEVRSTATSSILESRSCFLKSSGEVVAPSRSAGSDIPLGIAAGNYYLIVRHRNHLDVQSSSTYSVGTGAPVTYDFSTSATTTYGSAAQYMFNTNTYAMRSGDANNDDDVNALDLYFYWYPQNGTFLVFSNTDFNLDYDINAIDLFFHWYANTGYFTQVP